MLLFGELNMYDKILVAAVAFFAFLYVMMTEVVADDATKPLCSICSFTVSVQDTYGMRYKLKDPKYKEFAIPTYQGGKAVDMSAYWDTLGAVTERMPNMTVDDGYLYAFIVDEIIEMNTQHGRTKFADTFLYERYCGITGIPYDAAMYTLDWLSQHRPDVASAIDQLRNKDNELAHELIYNVPFNLAVTLQYLWIACPNLFEEIESEEFRAKLFAELFRKDDPGAYTKYMKLVSHRFYSAE